MEFVHVDAYQRAGVRFLCKAEPVLQVVCFLLSAVIVQLTVHIVKHTVICACHFGIDSADIEKCFYPRGNIEIDVFFEKPVFAGRAAVLTAVPCVDHHHACALVCPCGYGVYIRDSFRKTSEAERDQREHCRYGDKFAYGSAISVFCGSVHVFKRLSFHVH